MIGTFVIIGVCLFLYPFVFGLYGFEEIEFRLEIKNLSSPYYMMGVYFIEHPIEDSDYVEQEYTIALYVITFVFVFYKHKDGA